MSTQLEYDKLMEINQSLIDMDKELAARILAQKELLTLMQWQLVALKKRIDALEARMQVNEALNLGVSMVSADGQ